MTPVFLDSGFLIALEAADDQHHPEALAYWRLFQESPAQLVTTTYVLDEVATFFNRYGHHAKAVEIGHYSDEQPSGTFHSHRAGDVSGGLAAVPALS